MGRPAYLSGSVQTRGWRPAAEGLQGHRLHTGLSMVEGTGLEGASVSGAAFPTAQERLFLSTGLSWLGQSSAGPGPLQGLAECRQDQEGRRRGGSKAVVPAGCKLGVRERQGLGHVLKLGLGVWGGDIWSLRAGPGAWGLTENLSLPE